MFASKRSSRRHSIQLALECLETRVTPALLDPLSIPVVQPPEAPLQQPLQDEELLNQFGYDSMPAHGPRGTLEERPLLVVLVNVPVSKRGADAGDFELTADDYRGLIFGPSALNVRDYYLENSNRQFTWKEVGVIGPIDLPLEYYDQFGGDASLATRRLITELQGTDLQGDRLDFTSFDTSGYGNRNGIVENRELGVLVIDNGSTTLGINIPGSATVPGLELGFAPNLAFTGYQASLTTYAHELCHSLGALDIYGESGYADHVSLMGPTIFGDLYDRQTFHLDPWHKIQFGWEKPRIYPIDGVGGSVVLDAGRSPVLFFDRQRDPSEFYLMEFRNKNSSLVYDHEVGGAGSPAGFALWYVNMNGPGALDLRPVAIGPGPNGRVDTSPPQGDDVFTYRIDDAGPTVAGIAFGPDRILQTTPEGDDWLLSDILLQNTDDPFNSGSIGLLTNATGLIAPAWLDQTDTGLRIQVDSFDAASDSSVLVDWAFQRTFVPQINTVSKLKALMHESQRFELYGTFGVRGSGTEAAIVSLTDGVRDYDLQIISWSNERVVVQAALYEELPMENLDVVIYSDASREFRSNAVSVVRTVFAWVAPISTRSTRFALHIVGTASDDQITIAANALGELTLTDNVRGAAIPVFVDSQFSNAPVVGTLRVSQVASWTVHGLGGDDQFSIGGGNYARTMKAMMELDGGAGANELIIDDTAAADAKNNYTLTDSTFEKNNKDITLEYDRIQKVTLSTSAQADTVKVESSVAETTIRTGAGDDAISLTPTMRNLELVNGLVLDTGIGRDSLVIDDRNNPYTEGVGNAYLVEAGRVGRSRGVRIPLDHDPIGGGQGGGGSFVLLLPVAVNFSGVNDLTLYTGSNSASSLSDTIDVESVPGNTTIDAGFGADTIRVTPTGKNLELAIGLTVRGGAGNGDSIEFYDQNNPYAIPGLSGFYTLTETTLGRYFRLPAQQTPMPSVFNIAFQAVEGVKLMTGVGPNLILAQGTPGNSSITSGNASDTFVVGPSLARLRGKLTIDAGLGSNFLAIDDSAAPIGGLHSYGLGTQGLATTVTVNAARRIEARGITEVSFLGSAAADNIGVQAALAPTTINGGPGSDNISVSLESLAAAVIANGGADGGTLSMTDQAATGQDYAFGFTQDALGRWGLYRGGALAVTYENVISVTHAGTAGSDTFDITSTQPGMAFELDGRGGFDTLTGSNGVNYFVIQGVNTGYHSGTGSQVGFRAYENMLGQGGIDIAVLEPAGRLTGWFDGGTGHNRLDYSARSDNIEVNLGLGTATAVTRGVSNVQEVRGGAGNDLLVGNDLANILFGNGGRDLLIGGLGADTLDGGAGDDFLIGGTTKLGGNPAKLRTLLAAWSQEATLAVRLAAVRRRLDPDTIRDDGVADTLTGGRLDRDWFWGLMSEITDFDSFDDTIQ